MYEERLKTNEKDKVFLPINIEGGKTVKTSSFWNTNKSFAVGAGLALFLFAVFLAREWPTYVKICVYIVYWIIFLFIVTRFFIIEEGYYRKSFKRRKRYEITSSGINWGIIFTNDTPLGTSVGFIDGYIGCYVRLERGSIVGQPDDFMDRSYNCFSECIKTLNRKGYLINIINTCESAGKDKRLIDLSETIKEEHNKALRNLLIYDVAYMKEKAETTSYETDTLLVYTNNYLLLNSIIEDTLDATQILLQGAYRNRYILNENEILDLHKTLNGVDYMDIIASKVDMFEHEAKSTKNLFISGLKLKDGNIIELNAAQQKELDKIYAEFVLNGKKYEGEDIIKRLIKVRSNLQMDNVEVKKENKVVQEDIQDIATEDISISNENKEPIKPVVKEDIKPLAQENDMLEEIDL